MSKTTYKGVLPACSAKYHGGVRGAGSHSFYVSDGTRKYLHIKEALPTKTKRMMMATLQMHKYICTLRI
jgi:hypothetical protein